MGQRRTISFDMSDIFCNVLIQKIGTLYVWTSSSTIYYLWSIPKCLGDQNGNYILKYDTNTDHLWHLCYQDVMLSRYGTRHWFVLALYRM